MCRAKLRVPESCFSRNEESRSTEQQETQLDGEKTLQRCHKKSMQDSGGTLEAQCAILVHWLEQSAQERNSAAKNTDTICETFVHEM